MRASTAKLFGDELALDDELWRLVLADVKASAPIPVENELLLDARLFAGRGDYRRAVLDAAIACEAATKATFTRLLARRGVTFRDGTHLRGPDLEDWVNADLARVSGGPCYGAEADNQLEWIARLWDVRGRVAHGKSAQYSIGGASPVTFEDDAIIPFLYAAEHLVTWLHSL